MSLIVRRLRNIDLERGTYVCGHGFEKLGMRDKALREITCDVPALAFRGANILVKIACTFR